MGLRSWKRSWKSQRTRAKRWMRKRRMLPKTIGNLNRGNIITRLGYSSNSHYFKRKVYLGTVSCSSVAASTGYAGATQIFYLQDLPNYTEFTNLFDSYCIRYVKWYCILRSTGLSMIESVNNNTTGMPNIICARDYDTGTSGAPTNNLAGYQDIQQYSRSKSFAYTPDKRVFVIGIKPAVAAVNYKGVGTVGYTAKFNTKIDCVDSNVPHYGLRYVIQTPSTGASTTTTFDIYATYYLQMWNVR